MQNSLLILNLLFFASVYSACISESSITSGVEEGEPFSNKQELNQIDVVSLKAFITCTNDKGDFSGAQFIVQDSSAQETKLSPLGDLTGTCQQLSLKSPIEQINAS